VVTSASRDLARARWAGAGLDITGPTVTADDVTSGKPDPEPYLRGAALIGAAPERCVVFEDSASGARAARAAGADVIAVGDDAWDVEPLARVPDLRSVRVQRSPSHRFALRLDGIDPA
jgi:sugar-phosphatase